jgi:DNA polymerase III epsilon subunit family exonuclease
MQPRDNPPAFRHSEDLPRLKARAFEAIRSAGSRGAGPSEIAQLFLGATKVPPAVAGKLVQSLLDADRRVRKAPDGRYVLRALHPDPGQSGIVGARFCVVDVETTGVRSGSRIIEVGAVEVMGLERGKEFESLINVDVPIPPEIETLTGITADMLVGAPGPAEVLDSLSEFLGDAVFCAHNAPFDRRFVYGEMEHFCLRTPANPVLCTRQLARRALPGEASYSLDALASRLTIENEARHRALGDARATAEVLVATVERLMEQGVKTVEELLRIQRKVEYDKFLKQREKGRS